MKIVGYTTAKPESNRLVEAMIAGGASFADVKLLDIGEYLRTGLEDADFYVFAGILRGTGLVYKECEEKGKDFLFMDHAYFHKGYDNPSWMRITRNRHVYGPTLSYRPRDRFDQYFKDETKIKPWRSNKGKYILVLPPTHAMQWFGGAENWLQGVFRSIKETTDIPIKVRFKPTNPIVDDKGNLVKMQRINNIQSTLEEDIDEAVAAVVYNSGCAIECINAGVPVICSPQCPVFPISYHLNDLRNISNFDQEPNRKQLMYDLAYNQFNYLEMLTGHVYQSLGIK